MEDGAYHPLNIIIRQRSATSLLLLDLIQHAVREQDLI